MIDYHKAKFNKRQELFTDTYLTTINSKEDHQPYDKNVYKAIKQNKVEYLVEKDQQNTYEIGQLYNEEKEMNAIVLEMRKKYDQTKIQTAKIEKNIRYLEEQKQSLQFKKEDLHHQAVQTKINFENTQEKHKRLEESLKYLEYNTAIRLNIQQNLKHDILHYKKICFENNIKLTRTNTNLRDFNQRSSTKKNLNSKCKIVLNSLQQTVKLRQTERVVHLKEVESMLMRKLQNTQLKSDRQQQLQSSMFKALTQRLPEERQILNKFYCQLFLSKILRGKMVKLMEKNSQVELAFNRIRKETRINTISEFIKEFLDRQVIYGDLLDSIQKAEEKIANEKEIRKLLESQNQKRQLQNGQFLDMIGRMHKTNQDRGLMKQLNYYNQQLLKSTEMKLLLKRWAARSYIKIKTISEDKTENQYLHQQSDLFDHLSLKQSISKALKFVLNAVNQKSEVEDKLETPKKESSQQTNQSEQKFNLKTLTSQSVLSKECSKRNFRVRTMTTHQQTHPQPEHQYDELSQFDYLRFNRKIVKKNNNKTLRARIKTRAN